MSFALMQKFKYIFDAYALVFVLLTSVYGLLVDIRQSKNKGTNRDAKLAKRIYITLISLIVTLFIISKLM